MNWNDSEPSPTQLQVISELVKKADGIASRITNGEVLIKQLKLDLKLMMEETIPAAMDSAEISELRTDTGLRVEVKPFLSVSIPKDGIEEACEWLEENNHDEIIKTQVVMAFGKGKIAQAIDFRDENPGSIMKREVNWQTLNAWAREVTAPTESGPGLTLPNVFEVYSGQKAIITTK